MHVQVLMHGAQLVFVNGDIDQTHSHNLLQLVIDYPKYQKEYLVKDQMDLLPLNGFHGVHGMNVPVFVDKVSNHVSDGK